MTLEKNNLGFTLIELLVVISIISFLSSIILAIVVSARVQAQNTQTLVEVKQVQTAFALAYDNLPTTLYPMNGTGTEPYSCIGRSSCYFFYSSSVTNNSAVDAVLAPYISQIPSLQSLTNSLGQRFDGIVYRCENGNVSGCVSPVLYWVEVGKNNCTVGKTVNILSNGVICGQNVGGTDITNAQPWVFCSKC